MQGADSEPLEVVADNSEIAADLRRRVNGPLRWGLPFLFLSLPGGGACIAFALLVAGQSIRLVASLGGMVLILIGIVSFGLALFQRSRWQGALARVAVADELGLSFQEFAEPRFYKGFNRLEMFRTAGDIKASNVLFGKVEGLSIAVMDCLLSVGSAGNITYFENTVFVLRNVPRRVPSFFLSPRELLSRMLVANPELMEVPLANQPKFNKRFLLQGDDEEAIIDTFNAPLIALCLAGDNQNVEVRAPLLVIQQRGKRLPPARYRDFIKHCVRLAQTLGVAAEA